MQCFALHGAFRPVFLILAELSSARVDPSEQLPMDGGEQVLTGAGRGKPDAYPPHTYFDDRGDLQQLQSDRTSGRLGQFGAFQADGAQPLDEQMREACEQQPDFVGGEASAGESLAEQVQLMFLDRVFHPAAAAVQIFVEQLWRIILLGQIGHDKPRVVLVAEDLRFTDNATFGTPGIECTVGKLGELPDRKSTRLNSSHRCISYAV